MSILLFIIISALSLELVFQNFVYEQYDFVIDIIGNIFGTIFYIGGTVAIIFAILMIYKNIKNKTLKLNQWDKCFALLLLWGLFSVIFSEDKYLTFIGTMYRMDGYYSYLIYAAMYINCRMIKKDTVRLWLMRWFVINTNILCIGYVINGNNLSIFSNRNHFAYVLTLGCMLTAGLFIYEKNLLLKILYALSFGMHIYTLIYANTFGSYLGVFFALIFAIIITYNANKKGLIYSIIVFLIFIILSIYVDSKTNIISDSLKSIGIDFHKISTATTEDDNTSSGSHRLRMWKQSAKYISQRPIFGYGPEGTSEMFLNDGMENDRPHNEYIQCALFMGIPGLIFYLGGLITLLIYAIKNLKQLPTYAIISGMAVFAYCISAFFGNTMYYTSPYFFMILGMVSKPSAAKK